MAGLSNMALWVQVPLQPAAQQPASPAASMDAMSQPGNPAEAERTADTAASGAPQPQQQANGLQQQQNLAAPAASWGQMWNQLQALSGFHPRLGVLLQVSMKLRETADSRACSASARRAHAQTCHLTLCSTSCAIGSMASAPSKNRLHEQCCYMPTLHSIQAELEAGRSVWEREA